MKKKRNFYFSLLKNVPYIDDKYNFHCSAFGLDGFVFQRITIYNDDEINTCINLISDIIKE